MIYNDVIEKIGTTIDAAGVVMIVVGAVIAFVVATVWLSRRDSYVYRRFRHQLGQAILLGLELLVAGDIVRTVAASPSLTTVAVLAAIVFIRTFLSFSLEVETTGRCPGKARQRRPPFDHERPGVDTGSACPAMRETAAGAPMTRPKRNKDPAGSGA